MNDRAGASGIAESLLDRGDQAVAAANWVAAVSSWEAALDTPDRYQGEARIRWFLEATAASTEHDQRRPNVVVIGVVAALAGTGLVLMADAVGTFWHYAVAMMAWALFLVAAACGITYAFQYREPPPAPLTSAALRQARERAEQLDAASATMPPGPSSPA